MAGCATKQVRFDSWGETRTYQRVLASASLMVATETGFSLSDEEAEVLRLAVNADPKCYELGFRQVMSDVWDRNPRADLYSAAAAAAGSGMIHHSTRSNQTRFGPAVRLGLPAVTET